MKKYKTVWISDIHLGTRGCQSKRLLKFLKSIECDNLYLVGDIIDGWRMKNKIFFPESHVKVIRYILKMATKDTNVFYIAGNHDSFIRNYMDFNLDIGNNITIGDEFEYISNDKKFLITHGDKYDIITSYHTWIANIGDSAYTFSILLNSILNEVRSKLNLKYWSLSKYLKHKVKSAVSFIFEFEKSLITHASKSGYDGVICGHIHHPEIKEIDGKIYCNTGDWVESCSALVEDYDGNIEIFEYEG